MARERRYLLSAERRNSPPLFGSRKVFCRRYRPAASPLPRGLPWRRFPRASRHLRRAGLDSDTDTRPHQHRGTSPGPPRPPPAPAQGPRPPASAPRARSLASAAGCRGLPALTAEFVSDPSRELLGNLTPGSGCKRKWSGGSVGTGAGGGRLVRKPALLPRTTPPIPPSRAEPSRARTGRAGLEPPSVPAAPSRRSSSHKGVSGERAALPRRLRGSVGPVPPGCSAPPYLCRGSRRPRSPPRPRRARSRSRGLPWRRRTGGAGEERRAAAQAA